MKAKRFHRRFIEVTLSEEEMRRIILEKVLEEYPEGWPQNAKIFHFSGGGVCVEWHTSEEGTEVEQDG